LKLQRDLPRYAREKCPARWRAPSARGTLFGHESGLAFPAAPRKDTLE